MAKTNIDYLRELLTTDEQQEFLDAALKDHEQTIKLLTDEHEAIKSGLEDQVLEERQDATDRSIDTGIGTIHFRIEGSIDQQELMEALADIIAREGVRGLVNHLREIYAV